MKKIIRLLLSALIITVLLCTNVAAVTVNDRESYSYSNTQKVIEAPESYYMIKSIDEESLNTELSSISDIAVFENNLYILEKTNGLICVADENGNSIRSFGKEIGFKEPEGFYITENGNIIVADTGNSRIVKLDTNGKLIKIINAPDKKKTLSDVDFLPSKIVVDSSERLYVIVKNETSGIYQMGIDGSFLGFFGSVPVVPSLSELFWRKISTKAQLERMLLFVPTEYESMDMDEKGFIYTTVSTNTSSEIDSFIKGKGKNTTLAPIRKLNPKNVDVLVRNGGMPPAGDTVSVLSTSTDYASRFIDLAVKPNGFYCGLDSTKKRVFTYDKVGNLIGIFGNENYKKSGFNNPVAVCWWGDKIAVADNGSKEIKVFKPTPYCETIFTALLAEQSGKYDIARDCWQNILKLHSGNDLAKIGIGKYYLRCGEYNKAMKWFRDADAKDFYSKAKEQYLKDVGVKSTGIIVIAVLVIALAWYVLKRIFKEKFDSFKNRERNTSEFVSGIKYSFHIITHPFDGFWDMQFERRGNLASATAVLGGSVLISLISCFTTGYLVSGVNGSMFNILVKGVLSILIPFSLWCIANWSVTSLMNGSGTFKNIYMYTCYSLTPYILVTPLLIILSNVLTLDQLALYNIIQILMFIWIGFLLFAGTLVVHQYLALRTLVTIIVIIIAMGIIIFLFLLSATILQQFTDFVKLLIEEITFRI